MTDGEAEKVLEGFFVEREGEGVLEDLREVDLVGAGILDSLDFVVLAVFVESKFGKKLDLTDPSTFEAMRRFDSLLALVQQSGSAAGAASASQGS